MIEKTYAKEKPKVVMEQAELDELIACEREKAYWQGREKGKQEGNERVKKAVRAIVLLLEPLLDEEERR